jgi:hypothetical protein
MFTPGVSEPRFGRDMTLAAPKRNSRSSVGSTTTFMAGRTSVYERVAVVAEIVW